MHWENQTCWNYVEVIWRKVDWFDIFLTLPLFRSSVGVHFCCLWHDVLEFKKNELHEIGSLIAWLWMICFCLLWTVFNWWAEDFIFLLIQYFFSFWKFWFVLMKMLCGWIKTNLLSCAGIWCAVFLCWYFMYCPDTLQYCHVILWRQRQMKGEVMQVKWFRWDCV